MTHDASYEVNRRHWDERADAHVDSPDYRVSELINDPDAISTVVRFDLPRLGDIAGMRGIHLQCHIGTDTLSLHKQGAHMSGLDMSPRSIEQARRTAAAAGADIHYVLADAYSAPQVLPNGAFDLVYTGIGALCWLPSIDRWASVVASLLKPGGMLFIREGHPMMWALDPVGDDLAVRYPYFETPEPLVFDEPGTYVTTDTDFAHTVSHSWNHGLGEIVSALLAHGFAIRRLDEHTTIPWKAFDVMIPATEPGEFTLPAHTERVPMSYTLVADLRR
jgi:SAM-dependent methyltransferase